MYVRMCKDHVFEPPGRAAMALRAGQVVFVDDDVAAEWKNSGLAQDLDAPYSPPQAAAITGEQVTGG